MFKGMLMDKAEILVYDSDDCEFGLAREFLRVAYFSNGNVFFKHCVIVEITPQGGIIDWERGFLIKDYEKTGAGGSDTEEVQKMLKEKKHFAVLYNGLLLLFFPDEEEIKIPFLIKSEEKEYSHQLFLKKDMI